MKRMLFLAIALAVHGTAVAQTRVSETIAPQPLHNVLNQLSSQTGVKFVYDADVGNPATRGVAAGQSADEALRQLLAGTGLRHVYLNETTITIEHQNPPASTPEPAGAALPTTGISRQSVDAVEFDEVVVTGYRHSLLAARDLKRAAVGSQDAIVAEDIAAFPDLNLAEALQRVPGVAITRDAGEGRQISLRGLGPDFTRTRLNGMEVLGNTASGFDNRGSVSRTRSFDYSLFASELFSQVVVEKSYAAEQEEGGIGGTVSLSTARPFDSAGKRLVLGAKAQTNSLTDDITPRVVALASNRWDTQAGEFGALVSAAYSRNHINENGMRSWNWTRINVAPENIGADVATADRERLANATGLDRVSAPQALSPSSWYAERERVGLTGTFQWRPNDRIDMSVDLLYGTLSNDRDEYAMAPAGLNALTGNVSGTQRLNDVEIRGDSIVYADWSGVDMRNEAKRSEDKTTFTQAVWNGHFKATEDLGFDALVGWSRSRFDAPVFDKVFVQSVNHGFVYDYRVGTPPTVRYDFDPTDASAWGLMRADAREDHISSEYRTAEINGLWTFSPFNAVRFGMSYKDFANEGWQRFNRVDWYDNPDRPEPAVGIIGVESPLGYIVPDVAGTFDRTGQLRDLTSANDQPGTNYTLQERTSAAFVQYELDTDIGDMRLRANAGLRYYRTRLTSAGSVVTNDGLIPAVLTSTYDGVLPALNLALEVRPDMIVRLGASRNISRPGLGDLRAAGSVTFTPFGGSVNAGNPNLEPFEADAIDASWEYYIGEHGAISLGVFHKTMDSFITAETESLPYGMIGYPLSLLGPGQDADTIYSFSRPVNGDGASIRGAELAFQRDFNFLPAPFDGFGFAANVTYAKGDTDAMIDGVQRTVSLSNLSEWSTNATLYFETSTWGARVSSAWRDDYLSDIGGNGNVGSGYEATHNIDATAFWNITPNLKLAIEAINLTNEPISQFTDIHERRSTSWTESGRTYTLGLTYTF